MNSIPLTPPPRPVLRTPGPAPVLSLLFLVCVPSGCRKQPRKIRYQVVENPADKPADKPTDRSKPGSRKTETAPAARPSARPTPHKRKLTASPKLQVIAQGRAPRMKFSVKLPAGLRTVYQAKVSQVTSAPEPIGSFESTFAFQLTETLFDTAADRTGTADGKKRLPDRRSGRKGRSAAGQAPNSSHDPTLAGVPLQVSLDRVELSLPKRLHVDVRLLARQLEGLSYRARLLPDGTLGNLQVQGHVPKDLTSSLERLGRSLNRLQPPTPRLPLGTGARWRVTSRFEAARHIALPHTDIQVVMVTDYHLEGFEKTPYGTAARISTSITVHGTNQSTTVPIKATGRGKGVIRLLVNPTLVLSHHSRTTVHSIVQGKKSSNTSVLDMTLISLEPSAATASRNVPMKTRPIHHSQIESSTP